jgi:hypothetical protein
MTLGVLGGLAGWMVAAWGAVSRRAAYPSVFFKRMLLRWALGLGVAAALVTLLDQLDAAYRIGGHFPGELPGVLLSVFLAGAIGGSGQGLQEKASRSSFYLACCWGAAVLSAFAITIFLGYFLGELFKGWWQPSLPVRVSFGLGWGVAAGVGGLVGGTLGAIAEDMALP